MTPSVCPTRVVRPTRLKELLNAIGSHLQPIHARELLEAAAGRKASRLFLSEKVVVAVVPTLRRWGAVVGVSDVRYISCPAPGMNGWRHGMRVSANPRKGHLRVYVASTLSAMLEAARADQARDDERLGRALGIPACCRKGYARHLSLIRDRGGDPLWSTIAGTGTSPSHSPWTNGAAQYFGHSLLSFAPCSLSCGKAALKARDSLRLLESVDERWGRCFQVAHVSDIVYSSRKGIHRLLGTHWREGRLHYQGVQSTAGGPLARRLRAADAIEPLGITRFRIWRGEKRSWEATADDEMALFFCSAAPGTSEPEVRRPAPMPLERAPRGLRLETTASRSGTATPWPSRTLAKADGLIRGGTD